MKENTRSRVISENILKYINERKLIILKKQPLNFTKDSKEMGNIVISPIIANGDTLGSVIIITNQEITSKIVDIINLTTTILAKHLES